MNLFELTGKVALVTGCNQGIGQGMALALAAAGADIIGVSENMPEGGETEQEVKKLGRKFQSYQADFSDRASLEAFIEKVKAENPVIDILVNNAGTIKRAPAAEHSNEFWDTVLTINLDAPFILTREIGKRMVEQGSGKILFTASLLTFQGGVNVPGYAASKGAIGSLVKAFSNEWASKGVNVNAIAPGYIATANTTALRQDEERSNAILERIPAGRWGTPADFGGVTVFLSSKAADYIHGTVVVVDGGWMGR